MNPYFYIVRRKGKLTFYYLENNRNPTYLQSKGGIKWFYGIQVGGGGWGEENELRWRYEQKDNSKQ